MNEIEVLNISVERQIMTIEKTHPFVDDSLNVYHINFSFDAEWDGYAKVAIFANDCMYRFAILDSTNKCVIPHDIVSAGKLQIGVYGVKGEQVLTTRHADRVIISRNGGTMEAFPEPFEPSQFDLLMAELADVRIVVGEQNTEMENALQALEAGLAHVDGVKNSVAQLKAQAETAKDAAINAQNETEAIAQQVNADKQQVATDTQIVEQLKTQAQASATQAQQSATNAQASATSASNSATTATNEANKAKASEEEAKRQAEEAERQAKLAEETVASVAPAITELENTKAELHKLYFDGDSIFRSFADWEEYIPMTFDEVYDLCYQEKNFVYIGDGQMKYYPQLDLHVGTKPHSIEFISTAQLDGKNMHTRIIITEDELVKTDQIIDTPWFTHVADVADLTAENEQLQTQIDSLERQNKAQQRSIDALMKVNEGVVYEYQTDTEEAYSKDVLSGAITGAFLNIGGKSVVWNQLFERNGWAPYEVIPVWNDNSVTITPSRNATGILKALRKGSCPIGHVQYISCSIDNSNNSNASFFGITNSQTNGSILICRAEAHETIRKKSAIGTINDGNYMSIRLSNNCQTSDSAIFSDMIIIDLTLMFGAGNEPTSVDDPRIKMIEEYVAEHPAYNAGEILSANVDDVVGVGKNLFANDGSYSNYYVGVVNGVQVVSVAESGRGITPLLLEPNTTYTISKMKTSRFNLGISSPNFQNGSPATRLYSNADSTKFTFTTTSDMYVLYCLVWNQNDDVNIPFEQVLASIQIEKGSTVTPYSPYAETHHPIPTAIQQLDGYGWSAGNVYNEVDYANKLYIKRVGRVDLGTLEYLKTVHSTLGEYFYASATILNIKRIGYFSIAHNIICSRYVTVGRDANKFINGSICLDGTSTQVAQIQIKDSTYTNASELKASLNGVYLYYELAEPITTDISTLLDGYDNIFDTETGGSVTFRQSNDGMNLPVPNTMKYMIKLSEVTS